MLPNFLVIGAPRSGTSWIHHNLRLHPDIWVPADVKELHFFDTHYDRGLEYYESFFSGANAARAVGEVTPDYLHGAYSKNDIPSLIKRHLPNTKLIASLRNPVERAYSRYWNAKGKYDKNLKLSFEDKLKDRPEFVEEGLYARQLNRFYSLFPKEQILVLLYDDIVSDPKGFMHRIYEFLEVDSQFESGIESVRINAAAGKKNLSHSRTLWLMSRALQKMRLYTLAESVAGINSVELPPMSAETRTALIEMYRTENLELQRLLGCDLSHWSR